MIEAHRLDRGAHRLVGTHRGEVRVRIGPFDAIELDLALVWAR